SHPGHIRKEGSLPVRSRQICHGLTWLQSSQMIHLLSRHSGHASKCFSVCVIRSLKGNEEIAVSSQFHRDYREVLKSTNKPHAQMPKAKHFLREVPLSCNHLAFVKNKEQWSSKACASQSPHME